MDGLALRNNMGSGGGECGGNLRLRYEFSYDTAGEMARNLVNKTREVYYRRVISLIRYCANYGHRNIVFVAHLRNAAPSISTHSAAGIARLIFD